MKGKGLMRSLAAVALAGFGFVSAATASEFGEMTWRPREEIREELEVDGERWVSQEAFVMANRRCGAGEISSVRVHEIEEEIHAHFTAAKHGGAEAGGVVGKIRVNFHVIRDARGRGDVSDARLDAQLRVLNAAFQTSGFSFIRGTIDRIDNPVWQTMTPGTIAERDCKLHFASMPGNDPRFVLNIYVARPAGKLLGWGSFPWDFRAAPEMDGIVLLDSTLVSGRGAYTAGDTAVHAAGHWLGLFHVFQSGCFDVGDFMPDTPRQATPSHGCIRRDSCPGDPGLDSPQNYMDLADDRCMTEFTPMQSRRMAIAWEVWRSGM